MDLFCKKIINLLQDGRYHTAGELAKSLDVSDKTIRNKIKDIMSECSDCITIESKAHSGFLMLVDDYQKLHEIMTRQDELYIPGNAEERIKYLIYKFAEAADNQYFKLDDISEELYISKNSLNGDMKKINNIVEEYNLSFERKPGSGLRLVGKESDKRRLIYDYYDSFSFIKKQDDISLIIGNSLKEALGKYDMHLSEFDFQNIIVHLIISYQRIKNGFALSEELAERISVDEKIMSIVNELADITEKKLNVSFPEAEKTYIAIHFMSRQNLHEEGTSGIVIPEKIIVIARKMLEEIWNTMKIDLRNNLDLTIKMYEHLLPLDIRLTYKISSKNPLLETIRKDYNQAFLMAKCAGVVLSEEYKCEISDDELSYFAILFALAMESGRKINKKKVLLVDNSRNISNQLFALRFENEFSSYIEHSDVISTDELDNFDFSEYDVVFTRVPIKVNVGIPVINISESIDSDSEQIRNVLRKQSNDYFDYYYRPQLFFTDIKAENKNQVINEMCSEIAKYTDLPKGFAQSVIQRDEFLSTASGYKCALLHPYFMNTSISFVAVAVLPEAMVWSESKDGKKTMVQVLFLVSLSKEELYEIQPMYKALGDFIVDEAKVNALIEKPDFKLLKELFNK